MMTSLRPRASRGSDATTRRMRALSFAARRTAAMCLHAPSIPKRKSGTSKRPLRRAGRAGRRRRSRRSLRSEEAPVYLPDDDAELLDVRTMRPHLALEPNHTCLVGERRALGSDRPLRSKGDALLGNALHARQLAQIADSEKPRRGAEVLSIPGPQREALHLERGSCAYLSRSGYARVPCVRVSGPPSSS